MRTDKEHYAWRKKVAKHLPKLSMRVFALRNKMYAGCGFHYGLERQLGNTIRMASSFDALSLSEKILDDLLFKEFIRDLVKAEMSARDYTNKL